MKVSFHKKRGEAMGNVAKSKIVSIPGRSLGHGEVDKKFAGGILTTIEGSAPFGSWSDNVGAASVSAAGKCMAGLQVQIAGRA